MIGNEVRPKILPQYLVIALMVVAAVHIGKSIEYMKHLGVVCCFHMRQRETDWTLTTSSLIMDTQHVSETLVSNSVLAPVFCLEHVNELYSYTEPLCLWHCNKAL
jgi:hypothetical protein